MKTCSCRDRHQRKADTYALGCISTQKGAMELSRPEIHEPVAVWRSMLKNVPLIDRAGYVRR